MERYEGRGTTFKGCTRYVVPNSEVKATREKFGAQIAGSAYITDGRWVFQLRDGGGEKPAPTSTRAVPKK